VDAARLHRPRARRERGETLLEGPKLLSDALAAGVVVRTVFASPGDESHPDFFPVDDRALKRLADTESPRGPVAVIEIPEQGEIGKRDLLIAYGVSDPGNVGTLIRTAAAYGWAFGYTEGSADPWSPKVLRAGAGGQFQTTIHRFDDLPELPLVATVVEGGLPPSDLTDHQIAVLIGAEAAGLPAEVIDAARYKVTIQTPGPMESLNAAVAAGIVIHELSKRERNEVGQV